MNSRSCRRLFGSLAFAAASAVRQQAATSASGSSRSGPVTVQPTRQRTPLMIDTDFKMNAAAADTTIQPFKSLADKALEVLREKRRSFAPRIESRLPSPPSLNLPLALSSSAHCSFPCPLTFPAAFVSFPLDPRIRVFWFHLRTQARVERDCRSK